jgi:hypothetical protein
MKAKILIHIGYHKTATTWLQRNLWNNSECGFQVYLNRKEFKENFIRKHSLDFDAEEFKKHYEDKTLDQSNTIEVISDERLSGSPHTGGHDSKEMADRLYASFPEAKILIVIREQTDMIASSYFQYLKAGGASSLEDYMNPPLKARAVPMFDLGYFDYSKLINYYQNLFGNERVLVLLYEEFRDAPKSFCSKIYKFLDLKENLEGLDFRKVVNKKLSLIFAFFIRHINKFFTKTRLNPIAIEANFMTKIFTSLSFFIDRFIPDKVHKKLEKAFREKIKKKITGLYTESNQKLNSKLGLEMEKYGYML